jgi:hypothetical protein
MGGDQRTAVKVTIRKYMGDDAYSWAVFADGRPVVTGLSRREASYHRTQVIKMYAEKSLRNEGN